MNRLWTQNWRCPISIQFCDAMYPIIILRLKPGNIKPSKATHAILQLFDVIKWQFKDNQMTALQNLWSERYPIVVILRNFAGFWKVCTVYTWPMLHKPIILLHYRVISWQLTSFTYCQKVIPTLFFIEVAHLEYPNIALVSISSKK